MPQFGRDDSRTIRVMLPPYLLAQRFLWFNAFSFPISVEAVSCAPQEFSLTLFPAFNPLETRIALVSRIRNSLLCSFRPQTTRCLLSLNLQVLEALLRVLDIVLEWIFKGVNTVPKTKR